MISDLRWINIHTLGEASKVLQFGNKNRSAAATKINQSSSRRQSFHFITFLLCIIICLHNLHQLSLQPQHIYHKVTEDRGRYSYTDLRVSDVINIQTLPLCCLYWHPELPLR